MATRIKIPVLVKIIEAGGAFALSCSSKNEQELNQVLKTIFVGKNERNLSVNELRLLEYYGMHEPGCTADYPSVFYDALKYWEIQTSFDTYVEFKLSAAPVIAENNNLGVDGKRIETRKIFPYQRKPTEDEFDAALAEIVKDLSPKLANFVRSEAWDRGHSSGELEVLSIARNLAYKLKQD